MQLNNVIIYKYIDILKETEYELLWPAFVGTDSVNYG